MHRSVAAPEHPFTIASSAHADEVEFTVRHHAGGFTAAIAQLRPGSPVWVDGPHGAFTADDAQSTTGLVMIAGGVGVTPMFRDELADLACVLDLAVTEVLRTPGGDTAALCAAMGQEPDPAKLDYFICGSPKLVSTAFSSLDALGVPVDRVRTEQFDMA
jgi:predicted ferric reductase